MRKLRGEGKTSPVHFIKDDMKKVSRTTETIEPNSVSPQRPLLVKSLNEEYFLLHYIHRVAKWELVSLNDSMLYVSLPSMGLEKCIEFLLDRGYSIYQFADLNEMAHRLVKDFKL